MNILSIPTNQEENLNKIAIWGSTVSTELDILNGRDRTRPLKNHRATLAGSHYIGIYVQMIAH